MSHLEGLLIALFISGAYFVCERLYMFRDVFYRGTHKERVTDEYRRLYERAVNEQSTIDDANASLSAQIREMRCIAGLYKVFNTLPKKADPVDWRDFDCDHTIEVKVWGDDRPLRTYKECGCAVDMACKTCHDVTDEGDNE